MTMFYFVFFHGLRLVYLDHDDTFILESTAGSIITIVHGHQKVLRI
jgi:hypothetical protein